MARVLVISHDTVIQPLMGHVLEHLNHESIIVNDAAAASQALEQDSEIALMIINTPFHAPHKLELLNQLAARYPHIPKIVMTSHPHVCARAKKRDFDHCLRCAHHCMMQPFRPHELGQAIQRLLQ